MDVKAASTSAARPWVGQSIPRVEDPALLAGHGRFIDDVGVRPGTLPVERLQRNELIVNLGTARATGITIPPAVVRRADRVIA